MAREREDWGPLLELLPLDTTPDKRFDDEGMRGEIKTSKNIHTLNVMTIMHLCRSYLDQCNL